MGGEHFSGSSKILAVFFNYFKLILTLCSCLKLSRYQEDQMCADSISILKIVENCLLLWETLRDLTGIFTKKGSGKNGTRIKGTG